MVRRTGRIAVERPRAALWTTLALTCALLAVGLAAVTALTIDRVVSTETNSATRAGLVVYLGEGVSDARAATLVAELRTLSGIEKVELVTPQESARRLVGSLGSGAPMLEGVDIQSLPASVEVTLAPGVRDVVAMSPIVRELRGATGVSEVVVEDTEDTKVSGVLGTVRSVAWLAAALFAGLALLAALSSLRVRFEETQRGRHSEWSVVELLGGSPSHLVIPTALAGAIQGLLSAALAGGLLLLGLHVYGGDVPVEIVVPEGAMVAIFLGGAAAIGLVAGGLAGVSRTRATT
jgi:cell division transport system permease protein